MISAIFESITEVVSGLVSAMGEALTSVGAFFWNTETNTLTFLGVVAIIALGAGLVYFAISLVLGLIRSRKNA